MMTDHAAYMHLINKTLNTYSLNSTIIKGYALIVCIALFAITANHNMVPTYPIINLALTSIVVLLWIQDAHNYRQKVLYSRVYKKARTQKEVSFKMDNDTYKKDVPWIHIVWLPQVSLLYIGIVIASATISLIRV